MVSRGLDQDNLLLSKFVDACSINGLFGYGHSVFAHKTHPNIYLYNNVIKALSQADSAQLAINSNVVTALIQMYSYHGFATEAYNLFEEMPYRDLIMWNAMIAGCVKVGDMNKARDLFELMPDKNVISWTALIAGYAQINQPKEAIEIFRRMQLGNVVPDEITMLAALSACAQLGSLDMGKWIHGYIEKHRLYRIVPLNNALIDMYAKSGNIEKALEVFNDMSCKSIITWTTMIAGLALHGLGIEALDMFYQMERAKVKPNEITFISLLSACSHVGEVEKGRWYFSIMSSFYGIKPGIEHYGCMIDLYGRAGHLAEAMELLKKMPFEANGAIWGSLLAASRIHGDTELAEVALDNLLMVEPRNSGNYMLLSNLYADVGRWSEAGMVRKVMRDEGVRKMPGWSFIEVNSRVHEFIACDKSHPQSEKIYEVLCNINWRCKLASFE